MQPNLFCIRGEPPGFFGLMVRLYLSHFFVSLYLSLSIVPSLSLSLFLALAFSLSLYCRLHQKSAPLTNYNAISGRGTARGSFLCHVANPINLSGLVTSMAPSLVNLQGLVTSMAPNPLNLYGLVTSMASNEPCVKK